MLTRLGFVFGMIIATGCAGNEMTGTNDRAPAASANARAADESQEDTASSAKSGRGPDETDESQGKEAKETGSSTRGKAGESAEGSNVAGNCPAAFETFFDPTDDDHTASSYDFDSDEGQDARVGSSAVASSNGVTIFACGAANASAGPGGSSQATSKSSASVLGSKSDSEAEASP